MKLQQVCRVFILVPVVYSLFSSCNWLPSVNKMPTISSSIDITASYTQTPTQEPVLLNIPKDPKEYLSPEEFVGYYTASFEVSSFVSCSENDLPGSAKGHWIDIFRSSSFFEKYNEIVTQTHPSQNQVEEANVIVFVRFIGQRSNPVYPYPMVEHRGHMGLYKQEIIVTELLEMKIMEGNQCDSP